MCGRKWVWFHCETDAREGDKGKLANNNEFLDNLTCNGREEFIKLVRRISANDFWEDLLCQYVIRFVLLHSSFSCFYLGVFFVLI